MARSECPEINEGLGSSENNGFCEQIDVKEFTGVFDLGPRISESDELVCCPTSVDYEVYDDIKCEDFFARDTSYR